MAYADLDAPGTARVRTIEHGEYTTNLYQTDALTKLLLS